MYMLLFYKDYVIQIIIKSNSEFFTIFKKKFFLIISSIFYKDHNYKFCKKIVLYCKIE